MASRLEKLRSRRIDPNIKVAGLNEAYNRLTSEDSAVQYAIGAMQPIDPGYTLRTIQERDRVEKQLSDGYVAAGLNVEYAYQGSVPNNTHIRAHSDVDLLTLDTRFVAVTIADISHGYTGDPIACLRQIRKVAASTLRAAYPMAKVDETGSKAVNVSGGSLMRKIDVIASNWWHTSEYLREPQKHWLGIEILDNDKGIRIPNKPFQHNKCIDTKDGITNGGLRKLIRLLKSLKYDSDETIELSSYDIVGIVYNMFEDWLMSRPGQDLVLIQKCHTYLHYLLIDANARAAIEVPNAMRKVFCAEGATEIGLRQMWVAVGLLLKEIEEGLSRSFKKLAEARIGY